MTSENGKSTGIDFSLKNLIFISGIAVFIASNLIALLFEFYWLLALPAALVIIWLIFFKPDTPVFLFALLTPLSINYFSESSGISINLPVEPFILILTVLYLIKQLIKSSISVSVIKHPITLVIIFNLFWVLVTSFTSTMPLVSFKFFISRLMYVVVFYFIAIEIFQETGNFKKLLGFFLTTFCIVILIAVYKHSQNFFTQKFAHIAPQPFFKDHTIYGVILAFCFPVTAGFALIGNRLGISNRNRIISLIAVLILTIGIILSYTRAAWLSIIASTGLLALMILKIRFRTLLILIVVFSIVLVMVWSKVIVPLNRNKAVSSTDLKEHISSIYNISTDASNTERINRWNCAVRMFKEKPIFGWGPGTYMFEYAPFQLSHERTIISTNFGWLGNAHSEYLGPLAEQGLFGMLSFFSIVLISVYMGMKLYYESKDPLIKNLSLLVILSLTTYFVHGLMNNFLETDKASVLFWSFLGILTAMDINHRKNIETKT